MINTFEADKIAINPKWIGKENDLKLIVNYGQLMRITFAKARPKFRCNERATMT